MDFFEAQDRAKRRTVPLLALFGLAVLGTIAALYVVYVVGTAWLGLHFAAEGNPGAQVEAYGEHGFSGVLIWWQPKALLGILAVVVPTIGCSALYKWWQLRDGGPAVAAALGGRRLEPATTDPRERQLLNVVEEMALASGLAVPAVFLLPDEASINAFAAGHTHADAAIGVTRGALERLDRDELQGVIAHEFSHILNGDMRINTRLVALLYGLLSLVILGRVLFRAAFTSKRTSSSNKKGGGALPLAAGGLALIVVGGIGLLAGRLIQAAISRQREYLADAAAVQFTRNPQGIAGALKKLGASALGGLLAHPAAHEVGHFCFAQNFRSFFGGAFATHPPLDKRIRLLDPSFDGRYPELRPLAPPHPPLSRTPPPLVSAFAAPLAQGVRISPSALIGSAGLINLDTLQAARAAIDALPPILREAAQDMGSVSALACAICLAPGLTGPAHAQALALITRHFDALTAEHARHLHAALSGPARIDGLSMLHLAAPALRALPAARQGPLLSALDDLVHADGQVSVHEFALQKIIARDLRLAARPRADARAVTPGEASPQLSIALSFAARLETSDEATIHALFARAASHFPGLHPALEYEYTELSDLGQFDQALDQLALTPAPFRKRILGALAAALTADNELSPQEAALLRALAAALDCPLPPLTSYN